ncbi:ImmA/IrrE family metallo-endopeptidase [Enterococcus italicus]|uniref:ImmA/IrrE family metallo-endopeptidase n=1 Tax=Enterococcus italicus TaxID=246144 RepID=UPI0020737784|nr:ImmA/IrrE family metallo-endopeptidase [Enterococcus italicus]
MKNAEELMADFPHLEYKFEPLMPDKLKGLYNDEIIYLNPSQSPEELTGTIAEEIGHYLTTVGNIIDQDTNLKRKQERLARDIGATLVVSPSDIIDCYENGCKTIDDCVTHLAVTKQVFEDAISYYARRFNGIKTENGYTIFFRENGTVGVLKVF